MTTAIREMYRPSDSVCIRGPINSLFPRVLELLKEQDADDIVVFGGGIIPHADSLCLKTIGVRMLFTPGTPMQDIVEFVKGLRREP